MLLRRPPIHLDSEQRRIAADAMVDKLLSDGMETIALAVDDHHFHLLARIPDRRPRHWIGRAKMNASMLLRDAGLKGQVWARGSRALPIEDRRHQLRVYAYIQDHGARGAAVWTFRDASPR